MKNYFKCLGTGALAVTAFLTLILGPPALVTWLASSTVGCWVLLGGVATLIVFVVIPLVGRMFRE